MKKRCFIWSGALIFVFLSGFLTTHALASEDLSLRLWGQYLPLISGDVGSGEGAPGYNDAFDSGWGGGMELAYRPSRYFSFLIGGGNEHYSGKTHQEISFDSWDITPIYIGGKLHLTKKGSRLNPYLRIDIGTAHLYSMDVSYKDRTIRYWDSSRVLLFDLGVGLEYRFGSFGTSLEIKARYLDNPDSAIGHPSDADSSWTLPITLGFSYYF